MNKQNFDYVRQQSNNNNNNFSTSYNYNNFNNFSFAGPGMGNSNKNLPEMNNNKLKFNTIEKNERLSSIESQNLTNQVWVRLRSLT